MLGIDERELAAIFTAQTAGEALNYLRTCTDSLLTATGKKLPLPDEETESDYKRELRKSAWAACIRLRTRLRGKGRVHSRCSLNLRHYEGTRDR